MRELQIPPRCEGCPRLLEPTAHFNSHAEELDAVSAIPPGRIEEFRNFLSKQLGDIGLSTQEVSKHIPSTDDARIALMEQGLNATNCMEEVQRSVEKYTDGCPGKLTMRAPSSDGVTYEATLCRSHENYVDGEQEIEPVAVRRYPS